MPILLVPIIQQICLLGEGERFRDGDYRQPSYFLSAGRHKDGMQIGTISAVIPFVTWISLQRMWPLSRTSLSLSKYLNACSQRFSNSAKCPLTLAEGLQGLPARRMNAFSKQEMALSSRGNGGIYPNI